MEFGALIFLLACFFIACSLSLVYQVLQNVVDSPLDRDIDDYGQSDITTPSTSSPPSPSEKISWSRAKSFIQAFLRVRFSTDHLRRCMCTIHITSLTFLWYFISLSFTLFNKWFMQSYMIQYQKWNNIVTSSDSISGFNFPIFITSGGHLY
jgi:4-hydroxybenzoate polyprenyltransferase